MFTALFTAVESGLIYALMALGVYLSFRILDFPDLTVDGSFVTGAAVSAMMIVNGNSPLIATTCGMGAGFLAGCITGILNTKGKVNPLLSGILMMIALYSINLRIMADRPNVPLLGEVTLFSQIREFWGNLGIDTFFNQILTAVGLGDSLPGTWSILFMMLIATLIVKVITDWFLKTEIGLAIRATGDNKRMIRSLSANTDQLTILGLGISNGLVALSGALIAQYGGFADIGMGIGMIIIGLASVIIGEALFGTKTITRTTIAVIGGTIIYRIIIALALRAGLKAGDMKLITATIVIAALILPKIIDTQKSHMRKQKKKAELLHGKGDSVAKTESNTQGL
jgi:putative tryptophan/tyrosine transport system permease protein